MRKTLGVGVIGSGFMGQTYARTASTLVTGARLAAVAEGSRADKIAAEYGVPRYASYRELVACEDVDLICIATPHAQHAEHALAALEAGKHVLIDKPMACTVEACDAILALSERKHLRCSVTFTQRNRIGFAKAKEMLESGRLGRVQHIRSYQIVPNGMKAVPPWQMLPENVGILLGHGVHNIDAIRALTGKEVRSVFAKCRTIGCAPVEGTSDLLLTLDDGSVHYVFCSFELMKPGFPRSEVGHRVACEHGLIDIDPYKETRVSIEGGDWQTLAVQPRIDWAGKGFLDPVRLETYAALMQDLVDAIREDRSPRVTGWDGRQAVAAVLAAYESSRTGREIQVT